MAQNLFTVGLGFADDNIFYLSGSGVPLGTAGDITFDAPIGSYYSDIATGVTYKKIAQTGVGSDWVAEATVTQINALQTELNTTQAGAGLATDGSFTAITGSNYTDSATSITNSVSLLDTALKTTNDTAAALQTEVNAVEASIGLNTDGTFAGFTTSNYMTAATSVVDGVVALDAQVKTNTTAIGILTSNFAGIDAALQAEIDALELAAGVAPDGQMVPFTGTNYLNSVSTIRAGLVTIDGELKAVADTVAPVAASVTALSDLVTSLQTEVNASQAGAGLGADGSYTAPSGSNYLSTATSLNSATGILDAQIKTTADAVTALETSLTNTLGLEVTARQNADTVNSNNITGLNTYVGAGANAAPQYSNTSYVANNDSLTTAVGKLDAALSAVASGASTGTVTNNVTTSTVVDSVSTKSVGLAKWLVYVQSGANKQVVEVLASHDGDVGSDATAFNFTTYAKLRIGADIAGLSFNINLSGAGANQNLNFVVSSGASATIRTVRDSVALA